MIGSKKDMNQMRNFLINMGKEISLIVWVAIVFFLIVCSYLNNEYNLLQSQEFNLYEEISIVEQREVEYESNIIGTILG